MQRFFKNCHVDGSCSPKTSIPTVDQTQQLFLDIKLKSPPAAFCRRFFPLTIINSEVCLVKRVWGNGSCTCQGVYLHPCEVKVPANCAVSKSTSSSMVGRTSAPLGTSNFLGARRQQRPRPKQGAYMTQPRPTGMSLCATATNSFASSWQNKKTEAANETRLYLHPSLHTGRLNWSGSFQLQRFEHWQHWRHDLGRYVHATAKNRCLYHFGVQQPQQQFSKATKDEDQQRRMANTTQVK